MTIRPSNQNCDQWSAATMAAYVPEFVSMRPAPAAVRQPYMADLAPSAEPSWFTRVVAAAAGFIGALQGGNGRSN